MGPSTVQDLLVTAQTPFFACGWKWQHTRALYTETDVQAQYLTVTGSILFLHLDNYCFALEGILLYLFPSVASFIQCTYDSCIFGSSIRVRSVRAISRVRLVERFLEVDISIASKLMHYVWNCRPVLLLQRLQDHIVHRQINNQDFDIASSTCMIIMATEEDNFDIDIYGDGGEDYQQDAPEDDTVKANGTNGPEQEKDADPRPDQLSMPSSMEGTEPSPSVKLENGTPEDVAQKIASTDDSSHNAVHLPKQAPQTQGLKRQDGADDRPIDPGATTALFISDLHWWVTDDDIRGWANQSQCEDELEDITFSEHKVNGKSKGYGVLVLYYFLRPANNIDCYMTGRHMCSSSLLKLQQPRNKRSSPLERVSSIPRSFPSATPTLSRIPSERYRKMDPCEIRTTTDQVLVVTEILQVLEICLLMGATIILVAVIVAIVVVGTTTEAEVTIEEVTSNQRVEASSQAIRMLRWGECSRMADSRIEVA